MQTNRGFREMIPCFKIGNQFLLDESDDLTWGGENIIKDGTISILLELPKYNGWKQDMD